MGRKLFAIAVGLIFFYIASPLIFPISMGAVLAVLFFPWLEKLRKKKVPVALGSFILTSGITIVILMPSTFLGFFVAKTAFQQLQIWKQSADSSGSFFEGLLSVPKVHSFMIWITTLLPVGMAELAGAFQDLAGSVGSKMTEFLGGVFTHLPGMVMGLVIIVVSVYFFLVDGTRLVHFFRRNSFFTPSQTEQLISTLEGMCRSVVLASVASGGAQAFVEVIGCICTSTPNVALIGSLVFVGSFIPVVGSMPITVGIALQQLIEGHQGAAAVLAITALIVAGIDNMVRPLFLKGAANLHPLLAFVAAFGGLQTLGFLGVFLGPIIAALFVATVQIFTESPETMIQPGNTH